MRGLLTIFTFAVVQQVCGMHLSELENSAIAALGDTNLLVGESFTNKLCEAIRSTNATIRIDALMLSGIVARQHYLSDGERTWLDAEQQAYSNVYAEISGESNTWRRPMAGFLYAGTYSARRDFSSSYGILTNEISRIEVLTVLEDNRLAKSILNWFQLDGLDVRQACCLFAGMSAAWLGLDAEVAHWKMAVQNERAKLIDEFQAALSLEKALR